MSELQNTKLVQLLKTFSISELKEFEKFVLSSSTGKGKNYIYLVKILTKSLLKDETDKLFKEKIYEKLYPGKKYSEQTLKNLLTGLTKICEEFLIGKYLSRNPFIKKASFLQELTKRKAGNIFKKEIKQAKFNINSSLIDNTYYEKKFMMEDLDRSNNILMNRPHLNFQNVLNMGNFLIKDFIIKLSAVTSEMKVNSNTHNYNFDDSQLNNFLKYINLSEWIKSVKADKSEDSEILEIYVCHLLITLNNDDKAFDRFSFLFKKHYHLFPHTEKYIFYMVLISYCARKVFTDSKVSRIAFKIFQEMLDNQIYSYDKTYMTIILFRNIFVNALSLGEIEWTENYVKNYIITLEPEQRENMLHFCRSRIYFLKKKYDEALTELNKIKFELFTFKFDVKTIYIKIFYELHYFEEDLHLIDSYKHFLMKNKKVSKSFKTININFANLLEEIILVRLDNKKEKLSILKEKVDNTESVDSRAWLLEKINEIQI